MQVKIIEEAGYNTALYGFSLSYKDRAIKPEDWWDFSDESMRDWDNPKLVQTQKTATANAGRGNGHDKWLRQVMLWVDIEAPRYFWSEFDTYKVGTVAQSESTMHTLSRRDIAWDDFESGVPSLFDKSAFNEHRKSMTIQQMKACLPESYLQRRVVSLNYAVLRCIIEQRKNHRLSEWKQFIDSIYEQCAHPELLPKRD